MFRFGSERLGLLIEQLFNSVKIIFGDGQRGLYDSLDDNIFETHRVERMDPVIIGFTEVAVKIVASYINIVDGFLSKKIIIDRTGLVVAPRGSIDEQIEKINNAKESLVEGLNALDTLRAEAEANKEEVRKALEQMASLEKEKTTLNEELEFVRKIIQADVTTFQKIANVPSEADIRRERIVGFISGVLASIIASIIIGGGVALTQFLF